MTKSEAQDSMRIAETVTFGGSGLERAAELRGDAAALAAAMAEPASRTVLFWRGKPLLADGPEGRSLARLPLDHPVLAGAAPDAFFLGREEGGGGFCP